MRRYIFLLVIIALIVPLGVKYAILHSGFDIAANCDGPCLVEDFTNDSLEDRVLPNNLKKMQRVDAFQNDLENKPKEEMLNMDGFSQENSPSNFNNDCQFGQCLPTQQSSNR